MPKPHQTPKPAPKPADRPKLGDNRLTVYLDDDTMEAVKAVAVELDRSESWLGRKWILEGMARHKAEKEEKKPKPAKK